MTITLKCYANCDDVLLVWDVTEGVIPGCLGFAIEVKKSDGSIEALVNLEGFAADQPKIGQTQPTTSWPLQTYIWTDHTILVGTEVEFCVTAMMGQPDNLSRGQTSGWSGMLTLSPAAGTQTSAFFNRGVILSQFVSRFAQQNNITSMPALKKALLDSIDQPLMQFLTGELGKAIRGILQQAKSNPKIEIYCALFELDLDDLIEGLIALQGRAHIILGNGSVKAQGDDENAGAAQLLQDGGVDLHRRMVAPGGLAHNKFVVIVVDGTPFGVWTGSTNWTMTGLHTQINNGIAITNEAIATTYLNQWNLIKDSASSFTPALKASNGTVKGPVAMNGQQQARIWFTPNTAKAKGGGPDIDDLIALVNNAKDGILFVMFMPGQEPLASILQRQQAGLYVRGVVSTLPTGSKANPSLTYQIMNGDGYKNHLLEVIQPAGADAVGSFIAEFSRQQFLSGMGFAITHSKVIVIDPFGANSVVVTGSHNLSTSASEKNDENLLIIENCPELARAYAVNCMTVYQHYHWPASQAAAKKIRAQDASSNKGYLNTTDAWQDKLKDPNLLADLKFWLP